MRRHEVTVDGVAHVLETEPGRCIANGRARACDVTGLGGGDFSVIVDSKQYLVHVEPANDGEYAAHVSGAGSCSVSIRDPRALAHRTAETDSGSSRHVRAPMPGRVVSVQVAVGDQVHRDQGLVVVEAMKMQNELRSPADGRVTAVRVKRGDSVAAKDTLVVVE